MTRRVLPFALVLASTLAVARGQELVRVVEAPDELERWIDLKNDPHLLFSVQVPGLTLGTQLKVRAELGVTNDVATKTKQPGSFTYKGEQRYVIRVMGEVDLDQSAGAKAPGRTLGGDATRVTPQNHHGLLVVHVDGEVRDTDAGASFLNLVVRSRVPGAPSPNNAIKLGYPGAIKPPGGQALTRVDTGKGHLQVLVLSPGWESAWRVTGLASTPQHVKEKSLEEQEKKVAIALPLGAVEAGEVFDVVARLRLTSKNDRPQLASGQLVLTDAPNKVQGQKVGGHHGFNVPAGDEDTLVKTAAFAAKSSYPDGAWLCLVVNSNEKQAPQARHLVIDAQDSVISGTRYTKN